MSEQVKRPEWIEKYSGPFPQHLSNVSLNKLHEACAYALSLERKIAELDKIYRDLQGIAGAAVDGKATAEHAVARIATERNSLRSQAEALATALENVEWATGYCILCKCWSSFGHSRNCLIGKALAAYRAGKEKTRSTEP